MFPKNIFSNVRSLKGDNEWLSKIFPNHDLFGILRAVILKFQKTVILKTLMLGRAIFINSKFLKCKTIKLTLIWSLW